MRSSQVARKFPFDPSTVSWCVWLTVAIELVCLVLRFGFGQTSAQATASTIGVLTLGLRIHHGYIGLLIFPLGMSIYDNRPRLGRYIYIIGIALLASDLIHHFVVLWPLTGSPQFDLLYP